MADALLASDATGTEVFARALGIAGASKATSGLVLYPINPQGRQTKLYVTTSRTMTLADMTGQLLAFTSSGTQILTLPSFATLGWARSSVNPVELVFAVQREGTGTMIVTPAAGVTVTDIDGLAPVNRLQYEAPVMFTTYGDDLWLIS